MPWVAKNADNQLGKLIAKLKELGQFNDTLIVVTADHGSTYGAGPTASRESTTSRRRQQPSTGTRAPGTRARSTVTTSTGSPALKPLMDTGNVAFSYQSTAIETWLVDRSYGQEEGGRGRHGRTFRA